MNMYPCFYYSHIAALLNHSLANLHFFAIQEKKSYLQGLKNAFKMLSKWTLMHYLEFIYISRHIRKKYDINASI